MKPPPFAYDAPRELDAALELLAEQGENAKVLAGGQSLIAMLNLRLARPARLLDITRIGGLSQIRKGDNKLLIGTTVRQTSVENSRLVACGWPLLHEAVRCIAHPQIRNLGTVGGSVAHADPAAELPAVFSALDATFHIQSARRCRTVAAADFFVGQLTTDLSPDELIVKIEVPPMPSGSGHGFVEFSRRHGDFALGGAAAMIQLDEGGHCLRAALSLLASGPVPWRARSVEVALVGQRVDDGVIAEAVSPAMAEITPTGDIHGSSAYRRSLLGEMARRALALAASRARSGAGAQDIA